ncbi:MAG TPA: hypothetical protein VK986_02330, partial [Tepidisphaeraceae bacterium]|nr:hypothetical protein [Tepidisphaeraceae bacterium]
ADLELLCRAFVSEWPKSDRRSRIDLYAAVAAGGLGRTDAAKRSLLQIARSDTYEDVKADAFFHAAALTKDPAEAIGYLESSVAFPRERSLLEAGRTAHQLRQLDRAKQHLSRAAGMKGEPKVIAEAKELLVKVQAEFAAREKQK